MSEVVAREARSEDGAAMGKIYCRSWQQGYREMLPDAFLDALADENCAPAQLKAERCLVAQRGDEVIGLATWGEPREAVDAGYAELVSLYVLPEHWRCGAGETLWQAAAAKMRSAGYTGVTLWVLKANGRARRFYEKMGMRACGEERSIAIGGEEVREVRYTRQL